MSGRNQNKGQNFFIQIIPTVQFSHGINKHINTFIFKFITSADSNQKSFVPHRTPQQSTGYLQEFLTPRFSFFSPFLCCWRKYIFKTIRCNNIYFFTQKMNTFCCGNITYSCKTICLMSSSLFQRLLRNHIKTTCQFFRYIIFHLVIQRQTISGNTPPQNRSMGCKYTSHLRHSTLQIQQAGTRHPFMELSNNSLTQRRIKTDKTFNHFPGSITK